jgi:hypothetical protein
MKGTIKVTVKTRGGLTFIFEGKNQSWKIPGTDVAGYFSEWPEFLLNQPLVVDGAPFTTTPLVSVHFEATE